MLHRRARIIVPTTLALALAGLVAPAAEAGMRGGAASTGTARSAALPTELTAPPRRATVMDAAAQ